MADWQAIFRTRLLQLYSKDAGLVGAEVERTALRSESVHMRELLAYEASHGTLTFDELHTKILQGTLSVYSIDPTALARLAEAVALQDVRTGDTLFATRALELVLDNATGSGRRFGKLLAELYFEQRLFTELDDLLVQRPDTGSHFYSYIAADARNPFIRNDLDGRAHATWLDRFNRQFVLNDLTPIRLRRGDDVPFNRLTTAPTIGPQPQGPLVTVIMTSFKPERTDLIQSARSILEQSWRNLELLVVDDASPAEYSPVLDEIEGLDARARVIRLDVNGGTYAARNVGITHAAGEFITGQDADDWSHPQRIQTQVTHLMRNPHQPGNQVYTVNMTEDLVRIRRGYSPFIPSAPTLMARTTIMRELGGYIPARKASDNELRDRISAYSGSTVYQISEPLIFMRILPNSLSRSDFRPGWQHPARRAFWSSYRSWHSTATPSDLRRAAHTQDPIYIPPRFTSPPEKTEELDVVFTADWCDYGHTQAMALEEIRELIRAGYRVGVLHLESPIHISQYARTYAQPIQRMISSGEVSHLIWDETFYTVKLMLVRTPELLQFMPHGRVGFTVEQLAVVADKPAWVAHDFLVHYIPADCSRHAEEFFGRRPVWVPDSTAVRRQLGDLVDAAELAGCDYVTAFDPSAWSTRRRGPRNTKPVMGRWAGETAALWPDARGAIEQIWPTDGRADVRFYGDQDMLLRVIGQKRLPSAWLSFKQNEISRRTYYRSLDFFVHYPQQRAAAVVEHSVLEALAAGCIAVLPTWMRPIYGEAALYAAPEEVWNTIEQYTQDADKYLKQSRRGVEFASTWHSDGYRELMDSLMATGRPTTQERTPR
ncbi:glycosyltransferase family 2 protein [Garicola koreensis]|uniref:Glycosyltransferase 2-like domain-containing protein n=1 Tax=Garicola koreensis TaxID=1262554 RepID=A0A7W5TVY9_9MICC|nr:glycosyltransferase family 2 protein [Garicola koreensis]MBB3667609.1 hypothetical protein [Garicola koreensis]